MHRNPKKEVSSPKPPLAAEEGKGKVIATLMKKKSIHPTKPTGIIIGAWAPTVHVAPTAEWKRNPQLRDDDHNPLSARQRNRLWTNNWHKALKTSMDMVLEEQVAPGESYILEDLSRNFTVPFALFISYYVQVLDV